MNCGQATEFVSALCDGERIPHEAAEHISECEACRVTLRAYSEIGAELRCAASLEAFNETRSMVWEKKVQGITPNLWRKGWETMRVPRLAVVLMLIAIVALSSGLVILKARAGAAGQIIVLTIRTPGSLGDGTIRCSILTESSKAAPCSIIQGLKSGTLANSIRITARDGNRFELGVRSKFVPDQTAQSGKPPGSSVSYPFKDLDSWPEKRYWLEPDQKLDIEIVGVGNMTVTAELSDQTPAVVTSADTKLEPEQDELRVITPLLLQGKSLVFDLEGASATAFNGRTGCVFMYAPASGRYVLSLSPLDGAVEGRIEWTRIDFEMNGKPYQFVMGAPIANSTRIWILHEPNYRPSMETPGARDNQLFIAASDLKALRLMSKRKES